MRVSLVLVYPGAVGVLAQVWPLILLPLPLFMIHAMVIPFEEARLREVFGDTFDQYCASVRRWV